MVYMNTKSKKKKLNLVLKSNYNTYIDVLLASVTLKGYLQSSTDTAFVGYTIFLFIWFIWFPMSTQDIISSDARLP